MNIDVFGAVLGPPFVTAFLRLLTNSFFLVSTETTGWPSFRKDAARALMY